MKLDFMKEKKELVSVVLLGISAFLAILILVKVTGFFTASAKAENIVKMAVAQNNTNAKDMDRYFAKYKVLADALKKNNLFAPPQPRQHPVKEVWGIFGNEVLIQDKWYKVGDKVGDAKIVAIGPTQATIEWDGKKQTFAPIDAADSSQPGGPKDSREEAKAGEPGGSAQMVAVGSQPMGIPGDKGQFGPSEEEKERFMKMRQTWENISKEEKQKLLELWERWPSIPDKEKEQIKAKLRERFGDGPPPFPPPE